MIETSGTPREEKVGVLRDGTYTSMLDRLSPQAAPQSHQRRFDDTANVLHQIPRRIKRRRSPTAHFIEHLETPRFQKGGL